ncbi:RHS repeat-associated core domain-containing protein, partial [Delftia acidovorans]|uniref:RHS repeat-associated core domain-containing protein n=1 Tax=Delftia acidovorans TaxID=80866 RepID=UPI002FDE26B5
ARIAIHHYHCDHLGTPMALTDQTGQVTWAAKLDPWGNVLQEYNPQGMHQAIRLPGQHHDRETGLYYNRHRYYDPVVGSYINQDPIGLMGGVNVYAYAASPMIKIDPLGLWSTSAHNKILDAYGVKAGLSSDSVARMQQGSREADRSRFQDEHHGYMHTMSSKTLSKKESCLKANEFLDTFIDGNAEGDPISDFMLGFGLHAVMDSTSPAHSNFEIWRKRDFHRHGPFPTSIENDPSQSQIESAVDKMIDFKNGMRFDCSCFD